MGNFPQIVKILTFFDHESMGDGKVFIVTQPCYHNLRLIIISFLLGKEKIQIKDLTLKTTNRN